jgi:ribosomal protein L37AE/L43A
MGGLREIVQMTAADWDLVMSIRGGFPEKCDFCEQPYTDERYPVPEEAGAWACNECEVRWGEGDRFCVR